MEQLEAKEIYVPNDVYKFRISLSLIEIDDMNVYVEPGAFDRDEKKVKNAFFNQDRIDELKQQLIDLIMETKNPFEIHCCDLDGGYRVTKEQIFKE